MLSALRTGRFLPPGNTPGTHFCQRLSRPQGHSAIGRIMSVKNSNDTIWNRTSNLPICSAAPCYCGQFASCSLCYYSGQCVSGTDCCYCGQYVPPDRCYHCCYALSDYCSQYAFCCTLVFLFLVASCDQPQSEPAVITACLQWHQCRPHSTSSCARHAVAHYSRRNYESLRGAAFVSNFIDIHPGVLG